MPFLLLIIVIVVLFSLLGKGDKDKKNQKELHKRGKILDDQQKNLRR